MWNRTVHQRYQHRRARTRLLAQSMLRVLSLGVLLVGTMTQAGSDNAPNRPPATPLQQPLTVAVTGNPPGKETIRRAIAWEVKLRQQAYPGCRLAFVRFWLPLQEVRGAATVQGAVVLRAKMPGSGWREQRLTLRVNRLTMQTPPEGQLLVSNRPHEKVFVPQTLLEGRITEDNSARILYHHLNASVRRMEFSVELLNPSGNAVQVHILDALAGPMMDVISLGHLSALSFVNQENRDEGYIITVAPHTAQAPIRLSFPPKHIVSGLGRFRVLTPGGKIVLRVRTIDAGTGFVSAPLTRYTPSAVFGRYHYSVEPFVYRNAYIVGKGYLSLPLGEIPVISGNPEQNLKGGYGVWHQYHVTLINPSGRRAAVSLHISARGGPARLIYSLGTEWRETRMLRAFQEIPLTSFTLAPHEVRAITLTTVPQAGSAYPLRFQLRTKS